MKKTSLFLIFSFAIFLFSESCRRDFHIEEVDKVTDDLSLDGNLAGPLLDTKVRIEQFIVPEEDSSSWAEHDSNKLLHIRALRKNFQSFQMKDIYKDAPLVTFPIPSGFFAPAGMFKFESRLYALDIFGPFISGKFFIKAPKFTFHVESEAPILDTLQVNSIKLHNSKKHVYKEVKNISFSVNPATQQGVAKYSKLLVDTTKVADFPVHLSTLPQYASFDISTGNSKATRLPFKATGNEPVNVNLDMDFPLEIALVDLKMKEISDFDATEYNVDEIESAEFKIFFENAYPIDIDLQAYFVQDENTIIPVDSLFEKSIKVPRGKVDKQNRVTESTIKKEIVTMSKKRLERLKAAGVKKLVFYFTMNTPDAKTRRYMKILDGNFMGIRLGFKINYKASITEL
ncbi:MAG: hypothetical protein CSB06_00505 [Bacteroidia bacterium]|nr:MAG: hypothetical protein CSB06_00505 [Bacteroidia bacterium]